MPDLRVHALRHRAGVLLREASVPQSAIRDVLWHVSSPITHHDTVAQIVELHGALEKIKEDSGRRNKPLAALRQAHEAVKGTAGSAKHKEKRISSFGADPLI